VLLRSGRACRTASRQAAGAAQGLADREGCAGRATAMPPLKEAALIVWPSRFVIELLVNCRVPPRKLSASGAADIAVAGDAERAPLRVVRHSCSSAQVSVLGPGLTSVTFGWLMLLA